MMGKVQGANSDTNVVTDAVLVLNSGSSSLKAGLFEPEAGATFADEKAVLTAQASGIGQGGGKLLIHDGNGKELASGDHPLGSQKDALAAIAEALEQHCGGKQPRAVGHRIVHGGARLREHTRLTPAVVAMLRESIHFAPLHLPASLELIAQAEKLFPDAVQVACFDTAFHRTMPPVAKHLAVPKEFVAKGVERYGFHGLSYESVVAQLNAEPARLADRIVIAHLGSGSSLCAVLRGTSVDTTMGLTPAGGIPMATRTGDIDPGVLFFMARQGRLSVDALEQLVNHKAGLAAIADGTGDMQQLEHSIENQAASKQQRDAAALAFEMFATSIAKAVAGLIVSLAGLDLLVFTGGIGEHSAALRAAVMARLAPFGLRLDAAANDGHKGQIAAEESKAPVRIVPAEEDLVIARHTRQLLS